MSFFSLFTGNFRNTNAATGVFIETEPYEKGFAKHYEANIKPHVTEFEKFRVETLEEASKRTKISALLITVLIIGTIFIMLTNSDAEFFPIMIAFIMARIWIYTPLNKYKFSIKEKIFPNIFSFIGDYKYSHKCPDRVKELEESTIIPSHTIESSEDQIKGEYKGVKIDLFETNLEVKSGKNSTESVFKGVIINLSMHKTFNGQTIIKKDFGKVFNWITSASHKFEQVALEDPTFEKIFEVYSSNQIEARYLLTTAFMERLIKLKESFKGQKIECSFYDNKLLIMIALKENMFEPDSIYNSEDFTDDSKKLLKDMHIIFSIIDTLKLNQNIGM